MAIRWRKRAPMSHASTAVRYGLAIEAIEPRVLLSADALGIDTGLGDRSDDPVSTWDVDRAADWLGRADLRPVDDTADVAIDPLPAACDCPAPVDGPPADAAPVREIIIIDSAVEDSEKLLSDLLDGRDRAGMQLYLLDAGRDGVEQIAGILASHNDIDAVHILSHGRPGEVQLGSTTLSGASLAGYAAQLNDWGSALTDHGDILIYGCDLAADDGGEALVDAIGVMTGADVAASVDRTGNATQGGDWQLEYRSGVIQAAVFESQSFATWQHTLALVAYDGFDYTSGEHLGNGAATSGGSGWADDWSDGGSRPLLVTATSLQDPTAALDTAGGAVTSDFSGGLQTVTHSRNLVETLGDDESEAWFSFLLTPDDTSGVLSVAGVNFGAGTGAHLYAGYWGDSFVINNVGGTGNVAVPGIEAQGGQTYLLTVQIAFDADGTTDWITLHVDPTPGIGNADNTYSVTKSDRDLGTFTQFGLSMVRPFADDNDAYIDELRVGATYNDVTPASVIVVNTTDDVHDATITDIDGLNAAPGADGKISLREAILAANATVGTDIISFDIPDALVGGQHTITLGSALPNIDDTVVIAGNAEPDYAGSPVIKLTGAGTAGLYLDVGSDGSLIRGLELSGFAGDGIFIASDDNTIQGSVVSSNSGAGIRIQGDDNLVGGTQAALGNQIYGNGTYGIRVSDDAVHTGNSFLGNSIHANSALGIDLKDAGDGGNSVTPNDANDGDNGSNDLLNHPVMTGLLQNGADLEFAFDLDVPAGDYRIELFDNPAGLDPSDYGEGQTYLGSVSVTHAGAGAQGFLGTLSGVSVSDTSKVVATATVDSGLGRYGSTSEFGPASSETFDLADLWLSTVSVVAGGGQSGDDSWRPSDLIAIGDPGLSLGTTTSGTFSTVFDANGYSGGWDLSAAHRVTSAMQIGSSNFQLLAGDLLLSPKYNGTTFSSNNAVALDSGAGFVASLGANNGDLVVFRPDTIGDLSKGQFAMLVQDLPGGSALNGLTLVEQDTTVGGYALDAGDFLYARSGSADDHSIWLYQTGSTGSGATPDGRLEFLDGDAAQVDIQEPIHGIELIERVTVVGGVALEAGSLLLSVGNTEQVGSNALSVQKYDVFGLDVSTSSLVGPGDAAARMVFDGSDVAFNSNEEQLDALLLYSAPSGTAPVAAGGGPYTIDEGGQLDLDGSTSTDPDGTVTSWQWDIGNNGSFEKSGETVSFSWLELNGAGVSDDTAVSGPVDVALRVTDNDGNSHTEVFQLTVDNVAPTLTLSGTGAATAGAVYTLNLASTDPGDDTISGWTINWGDGEIDTINGNPASVTHTYANPGFTYNVTAAATDGDGTWHQAGMIVANYEGDNLSLFAPSSGDHDSNFANGDGLNATVQSVIGPDGMLYVSGESSGNVLRYNPTTLAFDTEFVAAGSDGLGSAGGIAFGPDGHLYVADYSNDRVMKFDAANGDSLGTFVGIASGGLDQPYGMLFGPDGDLYVASYNKNEVYRYDGETGNFIDIFVKSADNGGLNKAEQMAFGKNGHLYIASFQSNEILRFNGSTGAFMDDFVTAGGAEDLDRPTGLAFGPDGNLYVTDLDDDLVLRYDPDSGAHLGTYADTGMDAPGFITFLPGHQVSVAASANTAPTLTQFLAPVSAGDEDAEIEVTFAQLAAQGDEADSDGSVDAFIVKAVSSGTLKIGADAGSASAWSAGSNDRIDAVNKAFWTPAGNAHGTLNAFEVVARDNGDADSSTNVTAQVTVDAVNDAPTATNLVSTSSYTEGDASVPFVDIVVSDVDAGETITATLTLADTTTGTLSSNNGASYDGGTGEWTITDSVANVNIALANLVFNPAANNDRDTTISVNIDDGNEDGGSALTGTITLDVTPVNDAPTIGDATLDSIAKNTADPTGETVANLFTSFSDPDSGASLAGIAVIANPQLGAEGAWQYSTDGSNWFAVAAVADDNTALALSGSTLIRFLPAADYSGAPAGLDVRALDDSYAGGFSDTGGGSETRVTTDSSVNGAASAVSAATAALDTVVTSATLTAADDSYSTTENGVLSVPANGVLANDTLSGALPVTGGATLEYLAWEDVDGNSVWEDATGVAGYDLDFGGTTIVRDAALLNAPAAITAAYVFDGSGAAETSDLMENLPGDPTNNPATFEFWIRPSDAVGREILFDVGSAGAGHDGAALRLNGSVLEWVVWSGGTSNAVVATQDIAAQIASGEFIHVVASIDPGLLNTVSLRVDGGAATTGSSLLVTDWASASAPTGIGWVGGSGTITLTPAGADPFVGEIAAVRFYESVLSNAQVQQNYDAMQVSVTGFDALSAAGATVSVNADGSFDYDPGTTFDYLADGASTDDTFSYTVTDSEGGTQTATVTVTLNGSNDAPTATNLDSTSSYVEDSGLVAIDDIVVADIDSNETITATLTLNNTATGALSATDGAMYTAGTGVWQITDSVANVNTALANLLFIPVANNDVDTTISVLIDDGNEDGSAALTGTINLDVVPVNDAPTLSNFVDSVAVTNEDTEVQISLGDLAAFGDEDDIDGNVEAFIVKSISSGSLRIGTSALAATAWVGGVNDRIDATLNAYWTPAPDQNGSIAAFVAAAMDDAGAESVGTATALVSVSPVNDDPTASNLNSVSSYDQGAASVAITDIVVSDVDAAEMITATLTLADTATGSLSANDGASYDSSTGIWTITDSLANVNTALANLVFNPTAGNAASTTISVSIQDDEGGGPLAGTIALNATASPPVVIVPPVTGGVTTGPAPTPPGAGTGSLPDAGPGPDKSEPAEESSAGGDDEDAEAGAEDSTSEPSPADDAPATTASADEGSGVTALAADSTSTAGSITTQQAIQGFLQSLVVQPTVALTPFLAGNYSGAELNALASGIRAALAGGGFDDSLDRMRDEINNASLIQAGVVGSGMAVTTGLSVGYVAWLVRGGVLLSTALSSLPAWQFVDPLPVLARTSNGQDDDDDDSLESIIKEGETDAAKPGMTAASADVQKSAVDPVDGPAA